MILCIILIAFLFTIITIPLFAEIDSSRSCENLTLKECYDYCKSQFYLIGQDCDKIIIELKEIREIIGGST